MGNRKKNGKRSATSSSEDPSMRAWHLAEEVEKKLVQAKEACSVMMRMRVDRLASMKPLLIAESLWTVGGLIEDAQKAFKQFRSGHPDMAPKEVQS